MLYTTTYTTTAVRGATDTVSYRDVGLHNNNIRYIIYYNFFVGQRCDGHPERPRGESS